METFTTDPTQDYHALVEFWDDEAAYETEKQLAQDWQKLLEKLRAVEGWTVTRASGIVTICVDGIGTVGTYASTYDEDDQYMNCLSFYEGYMAVEQSK